MPYQFKLRFLYGFNPPIHEALGCGKGLHDALAEAHKRALSGDMMTLDQASNLFDRHLHTPYAYPALRESLRGAAVKSVQRWSLRSSRPRSYVNPGPSPSPRARSAVGRPPFQATWVRRVSGARRVVATVRRGRRRRAGATR